MKKLVSLVLLLGLAWLAWPFYSMYSIYGGMKNADFATLQSKIQWSTVRSSAKPVIGQEVDRAMNKAAAGAGTLGSLIKTQFAKYRGDVIDMALTDYVTPQGLTKVFKAGGDVTGIVSELVSKQMSKISKMAADSGGGSSGGSSFGGLGSFLGGLGGKEKAGLGSLLSGLGGKALSGAIQKARSAIGSDGGTGKKEKVSYGLGNLKHFAYGFTNMEIGVARDPGSPKSDIIAVMEFINWDWKLTKIHRP